MNDFDYEVKEQKKLARNALKKKNGRRSKKCTLPSDYLTPAQRKKMNGEVKVYKMKQPITYAEFKRYPKDKQIEYFMYFAEEFGCTRGMMCEMMGCTPQTMSAYTGKYATHLKGLLPHGADVQTINRFRNWLAEQNGVVEEVAAPEPVVVEEPKPPKKVEVFEPVFINTFTKGELSLSGKTSDICNTLFRMFRDTDVNMSIRFWVNAKPEVAEDGEE